MRLVISFFALMACVVGCSASPPDWVRARGDDPVILIYAGSGEISLGRISGELGYDGSSKCLVLRVGEAVDIPLWPSGAEPVVERGLHGVEVPGFGRFLEGDAVDAGGIARAEITSGAEIARCTAVPGRRHLRIVSDPDARGRSS